MTIGRASNSLSSKRICHSAGKLIHLERSGNQRRHVRQDDNLRWLHFSDNDIQAVIDLDQPHQLILPYGSGMLSALLFQPEPKTCLNIGVGGGSFERFFAHRLPQLRMTSLENDVNVIRLAREYFMFPPQQPVIVDDASRFLSRHQGSYDLIFCDIHQGDNHPGCLSDSQFHAAAFDCLNRNGVYAINLLPHNYAHLVTVLMCLRDTFSNVLVLDIPERRNLILFALKQPPPDTGTLTRHQSALSKQLHMPLQQLRIPKTALPPRKPY